MKKGISPLIATILLIAIVVGATTLVGPEILEIVRDRTEETTRRSLEDIDCRRASIDIEDVICENITTMEGWGLELKFEVRNTGFQDLSDFRFEYVRDGEWDEYDLYGSDEILPSDSSRTFTANKTFEMGDEDLINNITDGRFISGTCPSTASRDIDGDKLYCDE